MNDENKLEELFKKYNEEMKCHTSALSEEFQSRLSTVAEGVTMLNEKVDRIEQTQNLHTEILKSHTEKIDRIETTLDSRTEVDRSEFVELKQAVLAMS
ncbi:MAG: hypothetical protein WCT49_03485 [Candidatus Paceibacterota bacterium]|jgi:hypothetical protein|nr:hypothetical protein [Candidatus Paceibacterota bacterium]